MAITRMGLCRVIVAVSTAPTYSASGSVPPVEQLSLDRPRESREQQLVNTGSASGFRPESDQQLRDCLFPSSGGQQRQDVSCTDLAQRPAREATSVLSVPPRTHTSCCSSTTAPPAPLDIEPVHTEVEDPGILHLQRQVREALPPFLEKVAIKLEWNHKGGVLFARFDERLYVYRRKERDHTVYTLDPIARWKLWRDRLMFDTEIRYFQTEIRKQESKVRKTEEEAAKLQKSTKEWAGEMKTSWLHEENAQPQHGQHAEEGVNLYIFPSEKEKVEVLKRATSAATAQQLERTTAAVRARIIESSPLIQMIRFAPEAELRELCEKLPRDRETLAVGDDGSTGGGAGGAGPLCEGVAEQLQQLRAGILVEEQEVDEALALRAAGAKLNSSSGSSCCCGGTGGTGAEARSPVAGDAAGVNRGRPPSRPGAVEDAAAGVAASRSDARSVSRELPRPPARHHSRSRSTPRCAGVPAVDSGRAMEVDADDDEQKERQQGSKMVSANPNLPPPMPKRSYSPRLIPHLSESELRAHREADLCCMSPSGDLPAYEAQKSGPRRSASPSGRSLESPALVSNMLKDHSPSMNEVDAGRSSFSPSATSRASTSNWGSALGGVPPNCVVSNSGGGRSSAGGSSLGSGGEWGGRDYEINQSGSRRGGRDDHKRKSKRRKKGGAGGSRDGSDVQSRNREKHFSKSKRRSSLGSSAQSDANSESGLSAAGGGGGKQWKPPLPAAAELLPLAAQASQTATAAHGFFAGGTRRAATTTAISQLAVGDAEDAASSIAGSSACGYVNRTTTNCDGDEVDALQEQPLQQRRAPLFLQRVVRKLQQDRIDLDRERDDAEALLREQLLQQQEQEKLHQQRVFLQTVRSLLRERIDRIMEQKQKAIDELTERAVEQRREMNEMREGFQAFIVESYFACAGAADSCSCCRVGAGYDNVKSKKTYFPGQRPTGVAASKEPCSYPAAAPTTTYAAASARCQSVADFTQLLAEIHEGDSDVGDEDLPTAQECGPSPAAAAGSSSSAHDQHPRSGNGNPQPNTLREAMKARLAFLQQQLCMRQDESESPAGVPPPDQISLTYGGGPWSNKLDRDRSGAAPGRGEGVTPRPRVDNYDGNRGGDPALAFLFSNSSRNGGGGSNRIAVNVKFAGNHWNNHDMFLLRPSGASCVWREVVEKNRHRTEVPGQEEQVQVEYDTVIRTRSVGSGRLMGLSTTRLFTQAPEYSFAANFEVFKLRTKLVSPYCLGGKGCALNPLLPTGRGAGVAVDIASRQLHEVGNHHAGEPGSATELFLANAAFDKNKMTLGGGGGVVGAPPGTRPEVGGEQFPPEGQHYVAVSVREYFRAAAARESALVAKWQQTLAEARERSRRKAEEAAAVAAAEAAAAAAARLAEEKRAREYLEELHLASLQAEREAREFLDEVASSENKSASGSCGRSSTTSTVENEGRRNVENETKSRDFSRRSNRRESIVPLNDCAGCGSEDEEHEDEEDTNSVAADPLGAGRGGGAGGGATASASSRCSERVDVDEAGQGDEPRQSELQELSTPVVQQLKEPPGIVKQSMFNSLFRNKKVTGGGGNSGPTGAGAGAGTPHPQQLYHHLLPEDPRTNEGSQPHLRGDAGAFSFQPHEEFEDVDRLIDGASCNNYPANPPIRFGVRDPALKMVEHRTLGPPAGASSKGGGPEQTPASWASSTTSSTRAPPSSCDSSRSCSGARGCCSSTSRGGLPLPSLSSTSRRGQKSTATSSTSSTSLSSSTRAKGPSAIWKAVFHRASPSHGGEGEAAEHRDPALFAAGINRTPADGESDEALEQEAAAGAAAVVATEASNKSGGKSSQTKSTAGKVISNLIANRLKLLAGAATGASSPPSHSPSKYNSREGEQKQNPYTSTEQLGELVGIIPPGAGVQVLGAAPSAVAPATTASSPSSLKGKGTPSGPLSSLVDAVSAQDLFESDDKPSTRTARAGNRQQHGHDNDSLNHDPQSSTGGANEKMLHISPPASSGTGSATQVENLLPIRSVQRVRTALLADPRTTPEFLAERASPSEVSRGAAQQVVESAVFEHTPVEGLGVGEVGRGSQLQPDLEVASVAEPADVAPVPPQGEQAQQAGAGAATAFNNLATEQNQEQASTRSLGSWRERKHTSPPSFLDALDCEARFLAAAKVESTPVVRMLRGIVEGQAFAIRDAQIRDDARFQKSRKNRGVQQPDAAGGEASSHVDPVPGASPADSSFHDPPSWCVRFTNSLKLATDPDSRDPNRGHDDPPSSSTRLGSQKNSSRPHMSPLVVRELGRDLLWRRAERDEETGRPFLFRDCAFGTEADQQHCVDDLVSAERRALRKWLTDASVVEGKNVLWLDYAKAEQVEAEMKMDHRLLRQVTEIDGSKSFWRLEGAYQMYNRNGEDFKKIFLPHTASSEDAEALLPLFVYKNFKSGDCLQESCRPAAGAAASTALLHSDDPEDDENRIFVGEKFEELKKQLLLYDAVFQRDSLVVITFAEDETVLLDLFAGVAGWAANNQLGAVLGAAGKSWNAYLEEDGDLAARFAQMHLVEENAGRRRRGEPMITDPSNPWPEQKRPERATGSDGERSESSDVYSLPPCDAELLEAARHWTLTGDEDPHALERPAL